ncbi:NAD-dependent epimerase/dehydratase family protein [Alteraurantiacibacter aestuarii]|uniref:NAD(P)H-binding protein n=1 Tax=Alteraurantiacibacter aestuarii TaxID=650004 RepID=A0A844ZNR0_9SPHN|nr:NAD(P)H-binding protein [Alteraurantiacibacter aestuarii]
MTIAITGGTGFVGQSVLDEARRRGLAVRALTRKQQEPRDLVEWVGGDLEDKAALSRLVDGARAVLHIAGVVNAPDAAGFEHGNVAGTQNLLTAARGVQAQRMLFVSSLSAREPALSDYGRSKRLAEEAVQVSGLDWTIIRPPAIYGPRDTEMLDLFRAAKFGVVPMPGNGRASIIHVEDLARLLLDLVEGTPATLNRMFEPDDGREGGWSHTDLARSIGAAMGRRVWTPQLPPWAVLAAARLDRMVRGGKAKLTLDRARYMIHPDWVSSQDKRVPPELWQAQVATQRGLAATGQWYRDKGWL